MVVLSEAERRRSRNKFASIFPDSGPLRRELYPRHMEFFRAGKEFNERAFIAANRVGKTMAGAYEATAHLTGIYPHWWDGHRWQTPIRCWAAGDTAKTGRDIIQTELLGPAGDPAAQGTGMIPADLILGTSPKHGVADAVETIRVRHISGGVSSIQIKSYDQGRVAFQGTSIELGWLDEEATEEVYAETLTRTLTTNGRMMLTFTPLIGITPLVLTFLPTLAPQDAPEVPE